MVFSKDDKERWIHLGSLYPPTDEEYIRELEAYLDEIHKPFGGIEASDAQFTCKRPNFWTRHAPCCGKNTRTSGSQWTKTET